jgi:hypothetical protein
MVRIKVTLDINSGKPNPAWEMSENKTKEFLEITGWKEMIYPESLESKLGLGYRGFILYIMSEEEKYILPQTFRILGSQ